MSGQSPNPRCDLAAATEFLKWLRPNGPWVLIAIVPDGAIETVTADTEEKARAFITRYAGLRNIYYGVNPVRSTVTKKPAKTDIAVVEYALGDLDPNDNETPDAAKARYLAQLDAFEPKPSGIVDSGNGIQVLWRLRDLIPLGPPVGDGNGELKFSEEDFVKIVNAEERIKQVMLTLGSKAGTQNIDRILRLPGTINLPNAAKRERGLGECASSVIKLNGSTCSLDEFPAPQRQQQPQRPRSEQSDARSLPNNVASLLSVAGSGAYPSRSELLFAFINSAMRAGIVDQVIVSACLDDAHGGCGIFEHCRENGGEAYVKRQLEHAANSVAEPGDKWVIRVSRGNRHEAWRATQKAMLAKGCQVFVRGGALVEPLWRWEENEGCGTLSMKFVKYNMARLSDQAARHAVEFYKHDVKGSSG